MREGVLVLQPRIKKVKLEKVEPGIRRSESAMSVSSEASSASEASSSSEGGDGGGSGGGRKLRNIIIL